MFEENKPQFFLHVNRTNIAPWTSFLDLDQYLLPLKICLARSESNLSTQADRRQILSPMQPSKMPPRDPRLYRQRDKQARRNSRSQSPRSRPDITATAPTGPSPNKDKFEEENRHVMRIQPCPWCLRDPTKKKVADTHELATSGYYKRSAVSIRKDFVLGMQWKVREPEREQAKRKEQTSNPFNQPPSTSRRESAKPTSIEGTGQFQEVFSSVSSMLPGGSRLQIAQALRARWQQDIFSRQDLPAVSPVEALLLEALQMWIEKQEAE